MSKKLSPQAVVSLKEALCLIYWYKSQLKDFLRLCEISPEIINYIDWQNYKRQIVSDLIDHLIENEEKYLGNLTRLCYEVANIKDFRHLESIEDGSQKVDRAKEAVAQLKSLVNPHQEVKQEENDLQERQRRAAEYLKANAAVRQKLQELNRQYLYLISSSNPQKRGYELEKLMFDVFELFDLDPKASFRNVGEQIDGAFSLEGVDYLFEAKWQNQKEINASVLDSFSMKIRRKLENTLGVFLSINGFSPDGTTAHSSGRSVIILMDGSDLMAVLEERIDFVTLLLRKKRHAAQTGNIYLTINEILQS